MPDRLEQVVPPNLPLATDQYARTYEEDYRKVERLYFTRMSNALNSVTGNFGGRYLQMPHGAFYDTTTQSDGINTPNAVKFNQTVTENTFGVSVGNNGAGNPTRIYPEFTGEYNFQFSLQLQNTDNAAHSVGIWVRINGIDIPNTCTDITVPARKSASEYGYAVAAWNFVLTIEAGQYFELMWATGTTLVTIPYIPAWTTPTNPYNRPATPSAILTVTYVSVL